MVSSRYAIPAARPGHVSAAGKIDTAPERPARVDRTRYEDVGHGVQVQVTNSAGPQNPKLIAQTVIIASSPGSTCSGVIQVPDPHVKLHEKS